MTLKRVSLSGLSALALVAGVWSGCGGNVSGGAGRSAGSTGGPCYPNATCDMGLACVGGTCVVGASAPDASTAPDASSSSDASGTTDATSAVDATTGPDASTNGDATSTTDAATPTVSGCYARSTSTGGGTVVITPAGAAVLSTGPVGTWSTNGSGKYVVSWNTGYVDRLTVSPSGALIGVNNAGANEDYEPVACAPGYSPAPGCPPAPIAGCYTRGTSPGGGTVVVTSTGVAVLSSGPVATWSTDGSGHYVFAWNTGFTDQLTVSAGGALTGVNNAGTNENYVPTACAPVGASTPCASTAAAVGCYSRPPSPTGGTMSVSASGIAVLSDGPVATWTTDGSGNYVFTWNSGYTDRVALSSGGALTGVNNVGNTEDYTPTSCPQ